PLENTRLGLKDRIDVEPQLGGDFGCRVAIDGEPSEGFPGIRLEIRLHDCQELLEDVPVVVEVPLARELAVGIGELSEKAIRLVQPRHGFAAKLLPQRPDLVDGHLPEPGAEGSFTLPLEPGKLSHHHHEHLLSQIVRFITQPRNPPQPPRDQRQVNVVQPAPVGSVRRGALETVQKAYRSRSHAWLPVWNTSYMPTVYAPRSRTKSFVLG